LFLLAALLQAAPLVPTRRSEPAAISAVGSKAFGQRQVRAKLEFVRLLRAPVLVVALPASVFPTFGGFSEPHFERPPPVG